MDEDNLTDAEQQTLQAIEEGMSDVKAGRTVPMDQVFQEFDEKYDIHR